MAEPSGTAGFEVALRVQRALLDEAESALLVAGALSLTLTDPGDHPIFEPAPGETPMWPEVEVTGFFPPEADVPCVLERLRHAGWPTAASRQVGEADWIRAWMADFEPMRFGERLWIVPSHCAIPDDAPVPIVLDPGLAFGSGTHPTTALCLEFLDGAPLEGARVLDFGCGSGVLAIAAARLGAAMVAGIDIDPQARIATRENARRNGVTDRVHVEDLATVGPHGYDVILANILAGTLVEQAPVLARLAREGAWLALSGILRAQVPVVRGAYANEFRDFTVRERDGWALITARAR